MSKKKRRLKKGAVYTLIALMSLLIVLIIVLVINLTSVRSNNPDAIKHKENNCLIFYPKSEIGKEFAYDICLGYEGEKVIYDYEIKKAGDNYRIDYGDLGYYYLNKDMNDIRIKEISDDARHIISDYLRYTIKKDKSELYNLEFLDYSYVDNLKLNEIKYDIEKEDLKCYFKEYDFDLYIPLKYMQDYLNLDFGIDKEEYIKQKYIDFNKPMVAITFDDGPYEKVGQGIIDTFEYYDANATFFVLGSRLSSKELDFIKRSIDNGNEYGSHSIDHPHLHQLSLGQATYQIKDTCDYVYNKLGYQMKIYRSPYGEHRDDVSANLNMTDILWNVDSLDWRYLNADSVYDKVSNEVDNHDIILFHELYPSTASAIKKVVPFLIENGYQLVTVSELMEALGVNNTPLSFSGR